MAGKLESFLGIADTASWITKHAGSTSGTGHAIGANGRSGGNSARANNTAYWQANFDAAVTAYAGWAFRTPSLPAGSTAELAVFVDPTATNGVHLTFTLANDGSISIRRGTNTGTILATSAAGVIVATAYPYIEMKATIADAGGFAEVLVNGVSVVSFTGDTRNAGAASTTGFRWYHPVSASDITDIYYNQAAYFGDTKVELRPPTAEGNSSQWTPSTGTDNSANVDELTPNDDTDYNSSGTPGDKDTFVTADLVTTSGTVKAVQIVARVRKDDAGARSIVTVARLSATEEDSAAVTVNTTYGYAVDMRTTKPGGGAWTIADVNNAEFGYKTNA